MTNNISRRGFLGVVSAFATAVASGVAMPLRGEPSLPIQDELMDTIREYRVRAVQYDYDIWAHRPATLTVKYVYDPNLKSDRTAIETYLDDCVSRHSMRPVNVTTVRSHDRLSEATVVFM